MRLVKSRQKCVFPSIHFCLPTSTEMCISIYLYYNLDNAGGFYYSQLKITTLINVLFLVLRAFSYLKVVAISLFLGIQDRSHYPEDLHFASVSLETGQKNVATADEGRGENMTWGSLLCLLLAP